VVGRRLVAWLNTSHQDSSRAAARQLQYVLKTVRVKQESTVAVLFEMTERDLAGIRRFISSEPRTAGIKPRRALMVAEAAGYGSRSFYPVVEQMQPSREALHGIGQASILGCAVFVRF
jgi:hypothetical protein